MFNRIKGKKIRLYLKNLEYNRTKDKKSTVIFQKCEI